MEELSEIAEDYRHFIVTYDKYKKIVDELIGKSCEDEPDEKYFDDERSMSCVSFDDNF